MGKVIDLTGQIFGHLTVLEQDTTKTSRTAYWLCQCDCGNKNIVSVRGTNLRSGHTQSCGCLRIARTIEVITNDLTGQKFGKLIVIERDKDKKGECAYWKCRCSCGNIISVSNSHLKGGQKSCGCIKSKGEQKIASILKENNINYVSQKSYEDLIGDKDYMLRFDFFLPEYNCLIEYQGKQHYEINSFFGGVEQFNLQQKYDKIKRDYCKQNQIKLIEIPYSDYEKLNITYILERVNI